MQVIHDDELRGIAMIPLLVDWRISELCQIDGCDAPTTTIICTTADESPDHRPHQFGICEAHHQEAKTRGTFDHTVNLTCRKRPVFVRLEVNPGSIQYHGG